MLILGLLMTGLAVAALAGAMDGGDDSEGGGSHAIERDGVVGELNEGDDTSEALTGTSGPDILSGEGGDDTMRGGNGLDFMLGGEGDDAMFGQGGNDDLFGAEGDDEMHGGRSGDTLMGGPGNDTLFGGPGDDQIVGADITNRAPEVGDRYTGREGGGPYFLQTPTDSESNVLDGGTGDDELFLGEGDIATGGRGNDLFEIGHWVTDEANVPLITDFDETEDTLSVCYQDGETPPTITLTPSADDVQVFADGQLVARVQGEEIAFSADDVVLCPVTF